MHNKINFSIVNFSCNENYLLHKNSKKMSTDGKKKCTVCNKIVIQKCKDFLRDSIKFIIFI